MWWLLFSSYFVSLLCYLNSHVTIGNDEGGQNYIKNGLPIYAYWPVTLRREFYTSLLPTYRSTIPKS